MIDSCCILSRFLVTTYPSFSAAIVLNDQCRFALQMALRGLDWGFRNLLMSYRNSRNYTFNTIWNAAPCM